MVGCHARIGMFSLPRRPCTILGLVGARPACRPPRAPATTPACHDRSALEHEIGDRAAIAGVSPPRSLPKNIQFLRLTAEPRKIRRRWREFQTPITPQRNAPVLGAPVLRPARSSKVLFVKKFQTQISGHPFGDGWVCGTPYGGVDEMAPPDG